LIFMSRPHLDKISIKDGLRVASHLLNSGIICPLELERSRSLA
jgi:hypothetical protein